MSDLIELILSAAGVCFFLLLGIIFGRRNEQRHFADLERREAALRGMLVTNLRRISDPQTVVGCDLVCGQVVIATDYLKTFLSGYRKLVGGEMKSYETLVRRARREATLRMMEEAARLGATEIWNVQLVAANMSGAANPQQKGSAMCEALVYGTAVRRAMRNAAA